MKKGCGTIERTLIGHPFFFNNCILLARNCLLSSLHSVLSFPVSFLSFFYVKAAYCSPPNSPVNGTVHSLTGTKLGSTLRFSCDQGFRLIGQSSATCTRTAQGIYQWNAPVPLCQGERSAAATDESITNMFNKISKGVR